MYYLPTQIVSSAAPVWFVNYFYIKNRRIKLDAGLIQSGFLEFRDPANLLLLETYFSDFAEASGFARLPHDGGMGYQTEFEVFYSKSSDTNTWTRTLDSIIFLDSLTDSLSRFLLKAASHLSNPNSSFLPVLTHLKSIGTLDLIKQTFRDNVKKGPVLTLDSCCVDWT